MEHPNTNSDLTHSAVRAMKRAGVSITVPRMAVWTVIAQAEQPLDVTEIKRRLILDDSDIPMSSIYMTLKRFTGAKLFSSYTVDGKSHYSLSAQNFHQRIVCQETGREYWFADSDLGRAIEAFCHRHGFALSDYALSVNGQRTA